LFSSSPLAALIRLLLPLSTLPYPENSNKKPTHTHTHPTTESFFFLFFFFPSSPTLLFHKTNQQSNPTTTGEKKTQKQKKTSKSLKWVVSNAFSPKLLKKNGKNQVLSLTQREKQITEALVLLNPRNKKKLPGYYRIKHTEPAENRKKGKRERGSNPPTTKSSSSP
jgi:hypothetical protein